MGEDGPGRPYLSVVIPAWSGTQKLADMLLSLCETIRPMCDELIVTEDSGNTSQFIERLADAYLVHPRLGQAGNLAEGIKVSTGEFVALIDSDMRIVSGTLKDLCIPGHIVSPASVQRRADEMVGWFVVSPRQFLIELLPYEQPSQGNCEAIDLWAREFDLIHKSRLISSDKVVVRHGLNQSYGVLQKTAKDVTIPA